MKNDVEIIKNESLLKEIVEPLLIWYDLNKRDLPWRHNSTPYRVWISEIMLQQTRVDPVIPYYQRFMETFPDVQTLAEAREDLLMKHWEGLGYYSRARNLQKAARQIVEMGDFPADYEGWLKLPGIGNYTAGAICSIALGLPTPAVDGNVLRVLSRILCSEKDIASGEVKTAFTKALSKVYPCGKTSEFTQSLMELGATVCLPNGEPLCDRCPVRTHCIACKDGRTAEIPVKAPKKKRKIEEKTVLILRHKNEVALHQRADKGLLAKLWEFPNLKSALTADEVMDTLRKWNPLEIKRLNDSTHIFSHIEWHMRGYEVQVDVKCPEYEWVTIHQALEEKAIPSAFRCYINHLKDLRYEEI